MPKATLLTTERHRTQEVERERDALRAAWRESEEELDWIANIYDSDIGQRDAERIAKDTIARFRSQEETP